MKRNRWTKSLGIVAALAAAGCPIHVSAADDKKHEVKIVAECLYREAPAFFADAGPLVRTIEWNTDLTAAKIAITHETTELATYRVAATAKAVEVSSTDPEFPDDAKSKQHRSMISSCLFEAGYENILINKKD